MSNARRAVFGLAKDRGVCRVEYCNFPLCRRGGYSGRDLCTVG